MRQVNCIAGVALFWLMLSVTSAWGCSCGGGGSPCQNFGRASAVFVGTAIAVKTAPRPAERNREEYWAPRTFLFSVEQTFLGVQARELEVSTGLGGGDCGYDFKLGTRYVVYASQSDQGKRLITTICSRTNPLESAKEDLDFFRSLGSLSPGVTINGEVSRTQRNVSTGDAALVGPLADIGLVIEGQGERREIRTDREGRFSLSGLPAGQFKVTLQLPDELFTYRPEQELRVASRGCATVNYFVVDNGRLSGRVLDAEGQPAVGVQVTLMEATHANPLTSWGESAKTNDQGHYSFSGLPPGHYLLAVNLSRYPDPNDPTNAYPRTYYPGVLDSAKAEVITVGPGENVSDRELLLPVRRADSLLTGKVVWADGTPVVKAGISFREVTYHDAKSNQGMDADDQGYFTIKGYVGQTFVIEVRSNRPYSGDPRRFEPMERVEPVRVLLAKPSEFLNIVITKLR